MGRQIQVASTEKDTFKFETFLRERFDVVLFQPFASSIESLAVDNLSSSFFILIWNRDFTWTPQYKCTKTEPMQHYISNKAGAPLIEFSNTNWSRDPVINGRLYWEKTFSTDRLTYDLSSFEKFYDVISSWIKNNAVGIIKTGNVNEYYLEEAWHWKTR